MMMIGLQFMAYDLAMDSDAGKMSTARNKILIAWGPKTVGTFINMALCSAVTYDVSSH